MLVKTTSDGLVSFWDVVSLHQQAELPSDIHEDWVVRCDGEPNVWELYLPIRDHWNIRWVVGDVSVIVDGVVAA